MMLVFSPATTQNPPVVCVVAEIGVNHDGDPIKAASLIEMAKQAGADAVKFQLFDADKLLSNQAVLAGYQKNNESDVREMLGRLSLRLDELQTLRQLAKDHGLGFVASIFSLENFSDLKALEPDVVKIASPDIVNLPLIELAVSLGQPMFISTGTADLQEIAPAVKLVGNLPTCLLHCVSSYPTPIEQASINALPAMARAYRLPVGYSDHTNCIAAGALAVAAGACVIEKHLTYDRKAAGPDHAASFDPVELAEYVSAIRQAVVLLGAKTKQVSDCEREVRSICRQSICVISNLKAGHVLTENDLTVKRPGTGIKAADFKKILGSTLARDVNENDLLAFADLV